MNELDDSLVQLFAKDDSGDDTDVFVIAVRQRVAKHRRKAKAIELGLSAAIVATAGVLMTFVPEAPQYPAELVSSLLASRVGGVACVIGPLVLTWWARFGDT
jgi:hypothetical protein